MPPKTWPRPDDDANGHAAARRTRRHCARAACVVVVALTVLFFVTPAWDTVATSVATDRLRSATGRPRATMARIEGAFPFHFKVPDVSVPGWGSLRDVDVVYDGTYNPFRWTTQTGVVAHGDIGAVRVRVPGTDRTFAFAVDDVRVTRAAHDVWHATARGVRASFPWTASLHMDAQGAVAVNVTVASTVLVQLAPRHVRVSYQDHVLLDARVEAGDGAPTSVVTTWGGVVRVVARAIKAHGHVVNVDDVSVAAFDAAPHVVARDVHVAAHGRANTTVAFVDAASRPNRVVAAGSRLDGTLWGQPVHAAWTQADDDDDDSGGTEVRWDPPWHTSMGFLRSVTWAHRVATWTWAPPLPPLVLGPGLEATFGPMRVAVGPQAVRLSVRGGRFKRFDCVELDGSLRYATPTRLRIDHVALSTAGGERMHGTGEYALPERKLRFSFDLEMDA